MESGALPEEPPVAEPGEAGLDDADPDCESLGCCDAAEDAGDGEDEPAEPDPDEEQLATSSTSAVTPLASASRRGDADQDMRWASGDVSQRSRPGEPHLRGSRLGGSSVHASESPIRGRRAFAVAIIRYIECILR